MKEIVVLTEERSMEPVLRRLEEHLNLQDITISIITHNGISDLKKSLPRKLRGWRNPDSRFLIIRDNDGGDCKERKAELMAMAQQAGRKDKTMVRIVCQELEAWFIADRQAMHKANILDINDNPARLRGDPEQLRKPSQILHQHLNGYAKLSSASTIAPHLSPQNNSSRSFRHTLAALRHLAQSLNP